MHSQELARFPENPLISPEDVRPSEPFLRVEGIFNPAAARIGGETRLFCRVSETATDTGAGGAAMKLPVIGASGQIELVEARLEGLDLSDPRILRSREGSTLHLSSLSHIRAARSRDGIHFALDDRPILVGRPGDEEWGVEDPRISEIEGSWYLCYSAVSRDGVGVAIAASAGLERFERLGMALPPSNKDAALFPEKVGGSYRLLHRPLPDGIGAPDIWIARSPDLRHWGDHRRLLGATEGGEWESMKVGAGAPPLRVAEGWLLLYHGVGRGERYSVGAALLDAEDPSKLLARAREPIMEAETSYERSGFFGGAVFPCGAFMEGEDLVFYYGAADRCVCGARIPLRSLMRRLSPCRGAKRRS